MKQTLRKAATVLAALAIGTTGLSACAQDASQPAQAAPAANGKITVGYSGYTVSNPFFAGLVKGLENGAKAHGYELITTNANGDPNQQISDVENLLNRGVNYLAINPADGKAIAGAVEEAKKRGIPVFALADTIDAPVDVTLSQDHVKAGSLAVDQIVKAMEKKNGSAAGNVVDIMGMAGSPAANGREKGFKEAVAKNPGLKVIATQDGGWDTSKANAIMTDILQANPDIDAVFCANDAEAVGVSAAIQAAGRFKPIGDKDHIYVIGIDGPKPAIEDIRKGVQDASISQQPVKMSEKMIDLIADMAADKTVEKNVEWPSQLITKDNINSPEVKSYGVWADAL
jgi:ABC-type sugar transport system substrate-binding protein